ncbi:MFS transporter [Oceanirhabdus seepicola]|uniref:MFS transporter n=1 Tax=Oceanirhabdus seepicola TaxID=2828781 RepID=A0A9J6P7E9_9CLOT|nr:MFS transporter [Oceanirhabdus seepicola]MCM1992188.1 MFS transporter [Oceanirhabdus seepicola]
MKGKINKNWITLLILALAGGLVYKIPYIGYSYYDAIVEALGVNNTQYGVLTSAFGWASFVCYFPGGWIADRFSPKALLSVSFISMGCLGLFYSTFPSYNMVLLIHIAYGAIVCLTYWSVAIKAVRLLSTGGDLGKMFGFWEGGKQISGLVISYSALAVFAKFNEAKLGITTIIIIYSVVLISVGVALLFLLKNIKTNEKTAISIKDMLTIIRDPRAWLIGAMIFSAYHFHIGLNKITPYLTQVFGVSGTTASGISMFVLYVVGFIGAATAGILVDKFGSTLKVVRSLVVLAIICMIAYIVVPAKPELSFVIIGIWAIAQFANFAIRGIYFSSLGEVNISKEKTGIFIGFASFVGFIPDTYYHIFMGSIMDSNPGATGFKYIFAYMLLMTVICFVIVSILYKKAKAYKEPELQA